MKIIIFITIAIMIIALALGYFIENQITLQGYPFDLEMSSEGTLLVLTAE